jgi:D-xylose transport system substrate-binding protein
MIKKFGAMIVVAGVLIVAGGIFFSSSWKRPAQKEDLKTAASEIKVGKDIVIGFCVGSLREDRWIKDSDLFISEAEAAGATVSIFFADNDKEKQLLQVDNLILQGVNVLVILPQDAEQAAVFVEKAHKAGIKVLAYDRLIKNSDLDFYISFDNVKVGELQAKAVLDKLSKGKFAYIGGAPTDNNVYLLKEGAMRLLGPKIKDGDITLVVDSFTPDWKPEEAYKTMKAYLEVNNTIDAVIAANDGTAFGAIQALSEYGLAGKVPVSGQDAEMGACQRVVAGTQTVTVYKPIRLLANKAVQIAVAMARGEKPESNSMINNGKINVPAYFLDPIAVTRDNMMGTIIKDGFQSREDVYQDVTKK